MLPGGFFCSYINYRQIACLHQFASQVQFQSVCDDLGNMREEFSWESVRMTNIPDVCSINRVQENHACKVTIRSAFLEEEIGNPTKSQSYSLISRILLVLNTYFVCKYLYGFFMRI